MVISRGLREKLDRQREAREAQREAQREAFREALREQGRVEGREEAFELIRKTAATLRQREALREEGREEMVELMRKTAPPDKLDDVNALIEEVRRLRRPMSITIESEEASRLAGELAQLKGETMADAVTAAIRERLEREREIEERLRRMRAISERFADPMGDGPSAVEHGDFLYDERGLPR